MRNLFKKRKKAKIHQDVIISDQRVDDILTPDEISDTIEYFEKRKDMISKMIKSTENSYPPSQPEDLVDPSIWKPEYWNWFLNNKSDD